MKYGSSKLRTWEIQNFKVCGSDFPAAQTFERAQEFGNSEAGLGSSEAPRAHKPPEVPKLAKPPGAGADDGDLDLL